MVSRPSKTQQSKSVDLGHNYRRRRKAGHVDLSVLRASAPSLQASIIFLLCTISLVVGPAYSFLPVQQHTRRALISHLPDERAPVKPNNENIINPRTINPRVPNSALFSSRDPPSDEEEWRAMLAAFQMYKAAYGNLKVPLRFTVPALAPWPENAWGLKLGQRVAAIRSTGKYVHDENRRKVLDDMDFVWRVRAASSGKGGEDSGVKGLSFDQLYTAVVTYREHVQNGQGPINVPNNFIVPDCDPWPQNVRGLPLGKKIAGMRSKSFLAANPGAKQKLLAIGFQMDGKVAANDARFQMVFDALQKYKEIYGDLLVPQPFVVPEESRDWPEPTWGLRLGARVNAIRSQGTFVNSHPERREMLDNIGFVWTPSKTENGGRRGRRRKEEMEEIEAKTKALADEPADPSKPTEQADAPDDNSLEALFGEAFDFDEELGGDADSDAPRWGLEGGRRLEDAAARAEEEAREAEEYKPPQNLAESLAEAAERAAAVGIIEPMDESNRIIKGKREKSIPWFNDDFGGEFVFDDVVEALTVYKKINGGFSNLTDGTFVVPSQSDEFSDLDSTFGMLANDDDASSRAAKAMASFEQRIRSPSTDSVYDDLEDFDGDGRERSMIGSSVAFAPAGSPDDWPEHLGGMVLGNIVERIKDGSLEVKHLPERKVRLDELEFDWGDPKYFIDVPFEKVMCALYAYYLVRGDTFVRPEFVMPDDDPWPQALKGYKLGEAVQRIRELQNFFEAFHNDKVMLLRMVDFGWFPIMALPIDPNEPEKTVEMTLLNAFGHPDYAKMTDIPMGLPEKIIADGPFFDTDDPRFWWKKWHSWDHVKDIWYALGRRDNAYALRKMGYPMCAEEHEAKYGPGLFTKINETLAVLEGGIEKISDDEKLGLAAKVNFFRGEMKWCSDIPPEDRDLLLYDLDAYLYELTDGEEGIAPDEEAEAEAAAEAAAGEAAEEEYEYEYVEEETNDANGEEEYEYEYEEVEEEIDGEVIEEEEAEEEEEEEDFDLEAEIGLKEDEPSSKKK